MAKYFSGETTKQEYMAANRLTLLTFELIKSGWADDQRILVFAGQETGKNVASALKRSPSDELLKGGSRGSAPNGFTWAVKL